MRAGLAQALVLAVLLFAAAAAIPARAAPQAADGSSAAAAPQAPSTDDLKALVKTLENDADRQRFVAELKALIAAREQVATAKPPDSLGASLISVLSAEVVKVSATLESVGGVLFDLPSVYDWARNQFGDAHRRAAWLALVVKLAIVLAIAAAAEYAVTLLLRRARRVIADRERESQWLRTVFLLAGTVIDLVPVTVFGVVAYVVLPFTNPGDVTRLVILAVINANVIVRGILTVARRLLAPHAATLRLMDMSSETASYWFVWLRRLVGFSVYGYFAAEVGLLVGLSDTAHDVIMKLIGLIVAALVVVLVLQNRATVAASIRGAPAAGGKPAFQLLRARLADIWHVLAVLYVVAIYGVWALHVQGGSEFILRASVLSLVVIVAAKMVAGGGEALLHRFFAVSPDLKRRFPMLEARADRYMPLLVSGLRIVVYAFAALMLLQVWGFGSLGWLASDLGRRLIGSLASVAGAALVAALVWEVVSLLTDHYLSKHMDDDRAIQRRARARTLLPLLRRALAIVLVAIVALVVLTELGVNIAPLLAGAGVVGIAVGFGAQSLVKDTLTGLSMILGDVIAVGDTVAIGGESGTVESLSIRTLQLRDGNGAVHTIPFGEVSRVVNMSKDFAVAVFDVPIGYRENVDRVTEVVRSVCDEIKADPKLSFFILAPLEVAGIERFGDSAMILRATMRTLPGKQGDVMHAFNGRLKRRFDELGIEMPMPARVVYVVGDKEGAAPTDAAIPESDPAAKPAARP